MVNPRPTGIQRHAPGVRLTLLPDEHAREGTPLALSSRLMSFSFEDSERRADRVTLELDNHDLSLFESEELVGGAILGVSWGYPGRMALPRQMVVQKLKGFTTLTVEGRASSVLLDRKARTRTFENTTPATVAREIAREHGFFGALVDVQDTGGSKTTLHQAGETDARFLRRLASREEFEFYVDEAGFHFHERRLEAAPTHVFTWMQDPKAGDILGIHVESDLSRRTGRVSVRSRDPMERTTIESSATSESSGRATLGEVIEVVDPETGMSSLERRNASVSSSPSTATTAEEAEREADARFRRAERASIQLSMQVVGDPTLSAGTILELRGIGSLSGKYFCTDVKHTIAASGYLSELKLVRDAHGRRARELAREQGGERNRTETREGSEMTPFERVDPETGDTQLEYRREGRALGASDPEAAGT